VLTDFFSEDVDMSLGEERSPLRGDEGGVTFGLKSSRRTTGAGAVAARPSSQGRSLRHHCEPVRDLGDGSDRASSLSRCCTGAVASLSRCCTGTAASLSRGCTGAAAARAAAALSSSRSSARSLLVASSSSPPGGGSARGVVSCEDSLAEAGSSVDASIFESAVFSWFVSASANSFQ